MQRLQKREMRLMCVCVCACVRVRVLGMAILVSNYCETKISVITIIDLTVPTYIENCLRCVKLSTNLSKHCKTCHDS